MPVKQEFRILGLYNLAVTQLNLILVSHDSDLTRVNDLQLENWLIS